MTPDDWMFVGTVGTGVLLLIALAIAEEISKWRAEKARKSRKKKLSNDWTAISIKEAVERIVKDDPPP